MTGLMKWFNCLSCNRLRISEALASLILLAFVLNFTTGCYYYKVNTKTDVIPEDIRWYGFNNKFMILHYSDSAWQMNDIAVDSSLLTCALSTLPDNHMFYLKTDPTGNNQYSHSMHQDIVLNEVHVYSDGPLLHEGYQASVPFHSIQKIEVYVPNESATHASHVAPVVIIPVMVFAAIVTIIALTKSSCPYVYVLDDKEFKFAGEIYSGAVYASEERNDYLPLPGIYPVSGNYTIKIANRLPEIQFINLAELWVVDHARDRQVLADRNGNLHTLGIPEHPVSANTAGHSDISGILQEEDGNLFFFNEEPSMTRDTSAFNHVELTFKVPEGQEQAKLVIKAKNSYWGDYVAGEFTKYFGYRYPDWIKKQNNSKTDQYREWRLNQGLPLKVYIGNGEKWEFVDYFDLTGPLGFREMVMPVDLYNKATDSQIKLRLETGFGFWELDYAALDLSVDEAVTLNPLSICSAVNDESKDVRKPLKEDDSKYYIQPFVNDEVVIKFKEIPAKDGQERSIFLHTKGYYNHVRYYNNPPDLEKLETFRQPGRMSGFSFEKWEEAKEKASK
jgi:hypothetical protein